MTLPPIHFVHANSYPAGTYQRYLEELGRHARVQALDMHAHNPAFPVDDGWRALAQELVTELEQRYREPVVLVGHSMGGMLSLMAGQLRPELVRCVVLLDAPVVAGWRALVWRLIKTQRWADKYTPAKFSARRRFVWPDLASARAHFQAKDLFAAWAPGVLDDYLAHGLKPHDNGLQLRFSRETETAVYRALPHHLGHLAWRRYPVPIGFIGGRDSQECRQAGLAATRRLVGRHFRTLPGGHLFPMESPALAAQATLAMIHGLLGRDSAR